MLGLKNHWRWAGSVHAWKTRSRGALRMRLSVNPRCVASLATMMLSPLVVGFFPQHIILWPADVSLLASPPMFRQNLWGGCTAPPARPHLPENAFRDGQSCSQRRWGTPPPGPPPSVGAP